MLRMYGDIEYMQDKMAGDNIDVFALPTSVITTLKVPLAVHHRVMTTLKHPSLYSFYFHLHLLFYSKCSPMVVRFFNGR